MSNDFRKKTLFFILIPLVFAGGCSLLPSGEVPRSLVGKYGTDSSSDREAVMVTSIEMFLVTQGFVERKPVIWVPDIPKSFRRKLKDAGIILADNGVYYDYRMVIGNGVLQLRNRFGKMVFQKKFDALN